MITRYRIKLGTDIVRDLAEREAFELDSVDYPADWLFRNGTIPGHTIEAYDATPPLPPPEDPSATGAQMIDEAKSRGQLSTLLSVLDASERATLFTRRQIIAGSNFAEVLRGKLGVTVTQMENFVAAASVRGEV